MHVYRYHEAMGPGAGEAKHGSHIVSLHALQDFNRGGEGMMAGAAGAMEAGAASHLVDQRALGTSNGHRLQDTSPADLCQTCLLPQKLHNLPKQGNPLGNQIFKLMGLLGTFYIQTVTLHLYRRRNQQWAAWPFKNLCLVTKLSHCLATPPPF